MTVVARTTELVCYKAVVARTAELVLSSRLIARTTELLVQSELFVQLLVQLVRRCCLSLLLRRLALANATAFTVVVLEYSCYSRSINKLTTGETCPLTSFSINCSNNNSKVSLLYYRRAVVVVVVVMASCCCCCTSALRALLHLCLP